MTWKDCASMLGEAGLTPPDDWHLTGKLNEGCLDMELGILGVSSMADCDCWDQCHTVTVDCYIMVQGRVPIAV